MQSAMERTRKEIPGSWERAVLVRAWSACVGATSNENGTGGSRRRSTMTLQKAHLKLEMLGSGCASVKTAPVPNYDVFATVAFEQF